MNTLLIIVTFCQMPNMASRFSQSGMMGPGALNSAKQQCVQIIANCYEAKYPLNSAEHPKFLKECLTGVVNK